MEIRKCPGCGKTDTAGYGFCIYCGKEFTPENAPIIHINERMPPVQNPNNTKGNTTPNPTINKENIDNVSSDFPANEEIKMTSENNDSEIAKPKRSLGLNLLIIFGYALALIGSFLGLIISIYLLTRKDHSLKRHGVIQLAIYAFYIVLLVILFANGTLTWDTIAQVGQMEYNNLTHMF